MLVLSRQRDETIMIGDDIEITVVDIRGDKVRVGITAPSRIAVHRKEVYEAIRQENEKAAAAMRGEVEVIEKGLRAGAGLMNGSTRASGPALRGPSGPGVPGVPGASGPERKRA